MIDLTALLPKLLRANGANAELAVKIAWSKAAGPGLRRRQFRFDWCRRL